MFAEEEEEDHYMKSYGDMEVKLHISITLKTG
jgi:hypothetical protein